MRFRRFYYEWTKQGYCIFIVFYGNYINMCTSFVHMVVVIIIPAAPRSNLFLCLVIHLFVGNCTVVTVVTVLLILLPPPKIRLVDLQSLYFLVFSSCPDHVHKLSSWSSPHDLCLRQSIRATQWTILNIEVDNRTIPYLLSKIVLSS